ncbi:hypothetical protein VTN77DRAFT_8964 [Rasamsonia byssochlamydoides]|uniref:uncharacterized protein n=1 Tax=Rasamsonia byssochlamydoides TaxID=89139 RepID=UPI0037420721
MKKHTNAAGVDPHLHMSYTSRTWVSDEVREFETYTRVQANMVHIAPDSPFVPTSWAEWLAHRLLMKEEAYKEGLRQLAIKMERKTSGCKEIVQPTFGGKVFLDIFSSVLSRESIWRPGEVELPARGEHAPWPDQDELKHEGYQRSRSGYNRFPPLPRVPGNATVNWKQRAPIVPFEFDAVGRPTMSREEVAPENDDMMSFLIGNSILQELET